MKPALFFILGLGLACVMNIAVLFLPTQIHAQTSFTTTLDTTYIINESGQTTIKNEFTITNTSPTLYITQYAWQIAGGNSIQNVVVKNGDTIIPANVVSLNNQTSVGITFPDKIVGEGKSRNFSIEYQNPDAASINGQVLEVYVPALAQDNNFDDYAVTLQTPARFGQPHKTTPAEFVTEDLGNYILTQFTHPGANGVSAIFGDTQIFNLTLRYYLKNDTNSRGLAQIALPPDTAWQKLNYTDLDPQPQKMDIDADGNWIASYQLPANTDTLVHLTAQAQLSLEPNPSIPIPTPSKELVATQKFWEVNDSAIKEIAKQYTSPRAIYDHVVNTLNYDYSKNQAEAPERLGAAQAFANPDLATCQEFTDAFVAVARANNIPARRVTGYAYTQNSRQRPLSLVSDLLHAWPEYYDQTTKRWQPIDPTWQKTTGGVNYFDQFDLNHIVLAINGSSSTLPYAAGSYKNGTDNTKDVEVTFGHEFTTPAPNFKVTAEPRKIMNIAIPGFYTINLTNQTGQAWYNTHLTLSSADRDVHLSQHQVNVPALLPFQTYSQPITVYTNSGLEATENELTVTIDGLTNYEETHRPTFSVAIRPAFFNPSLSFGLIGVGVGCTVLALITGSVLVYRRKR